VFVFTAVTSIKKDLYCHGIYLYDWQNKNVKRRYNFEFIIPAKLYDCHKTATLQKGQRGVSSPGKGVLF
jgi:hypothetical protein